jgi:cytoplasmic iron level regulating protein YaaA (DUF328/UPF0246 family)
MNYFTPHTQETAPESKPTLPSFKNYTEELLHQVKTLIAEKNLEQIWRISHQLNKVFLREIQKKNNS